MSSRTQHDAVQQFVDNTQRVVSCVTRSVVSVRGGYYVTDQPHRLALGDGEYHPLRGNSRLSLSIMLYYRIVEGFNEPGTWRTQITGYLYTFADHFQQEVLAYHWHPDQRGYATWPHLHLEAGAQVGREDVANAHLVTGWVTLADVIHLAITEFGVTPRRDNWQAILDDVRSIDSQLRGL